MELNTKRQSIKVNNDPWPQHDLVWHSGVLVYRSEILNSQVCLKRMSIVNPLMISNRVVNKMTQDGSSRRGMYFQFVKPGSGLTIFFNL